MMEGHYKNKIKELKDKNLYRSLKGEWSAGFINFTANDYLALNHRTEIVMAGVAAAEIYGAGATASRVAGGNHPLYAKLESALAATKNAEDALVFGSGYLTNMGVIPALVGEGDVVFADKLAHSCILEGVKLSGAKLVRFAHNDMADLRRRLAAGSTGKKLVITEEIFSMDGDAAPLPELRALCDEFGAWLMVDGAHSLYNAAPKGIDVYVGTLSKALAGYGGYVCGSAVLVEYLKTKAKTFIYSTGLPPFVIGAAIEALRIARDEKPYVKTLENTAYLCAELGIKPTGSAIVPIILGSEENALKAENYLRENKILVTAIRPPTVPKGSARLRVSVTAAHRKSEIDLLVEKLKELGAV